MAHYLMFSARELYPAIALKTTLGKLSWVDGKRLTGAIPPLEFSIDSSEPFQWCDYFRPATNIPLFSPLLRRALEEAGVDNVEFHAATVSHRASGAMKPYWAGNVVGLMRGMDRKQSVFESFPGSDLVASQIDKLVLDDAALSEVGMCRLAEFDLLVVVDERVKRAIDASGANGVVLVKPEDWDGFSS